MTDKTIDFLKHIETIDKLNHPLDKQRIKEVIESLSKEDEVIWGYVDFCAKLINNIGLWRDILSSVSNHERCESLIDSLNEEQLINFSRIVISLKNAVETDDIDEVLHATSNLKTPTEASIEKASQLLDTIKGKDISDLESIAGEIFQLQSL